jgi:hypothetical protein
MGDPLSVTASVFAILQISEAVLSRCWQYINDARSAKKDVMRTIDTISSLNGILSQLKGLAGNHADPRLPCLTALNTHDGTLQACEAALKELDKGLGPAPATMNVIKAMKWPFKAKDIENIVERIEKFKTTVILALGGDSVQTILRIDDSVTQIGTAVQDIVIDQRSNHMSTSAGIARIEDSVQNVAVDQKQSTSIIEGRFSEIGSSMLNSTIDRKRDHVIKWLWSSANPSTNHHAARSKHEPGTGAWLIESEGFENWQTNANRLMWIHAIPGAGKTILCSTIIDQIEMICRSNPSSEYAYFYFDFNDQHKQTVSGLLRSLVAQLCDRRPTLPPEVESLYDWHNGWQEPRNQNLIQIIISLLSSSDRIFLIIDALDECIERYELCQMIHQLMGGYSESLKLLVTSRKEQDITTSLRDIVHVEIGIQTTEVDNDIELHVQKCLENDPKLKRWNEAIKYEILDSLVRGSCGM